MRSLIIVTTLLTVSISTRATADWPAHRHDAQRTATGDGPSAITIPAPVFRAPLGGTLGPQQYVAQDVDADGLREIVFIMGGAVRAKTADDAVVWETPALDAVRVDGLVDLNDDGAPELVVTAEAGRLHVIDPRDGAVLWSLPSGVVGNIGNVLFHDFDSDGATDLFFSSQACGSSGFIAEVARAYSFRGDRSAPSELFELDPGHRDYLCGANNVIADVDGDGEVELVVQGTRHLYVYSTRTGQLVSTSEDIGSLPYSQARARAADVDGDGDDELILWTDSGYAPSVNSRRVFMVDRDAAAERLVRRWEVGVEDLSLDHHIYGDGGLADLDGDGDLEVVTSFYRRSTETWRTVVLDAATGAEIAAEPDVFFEGLVDLDADGRPEVITSETASHGIRALSLGAGGLSRVFRLPGATPLTRAPLADRRVGTVPRALVAIDLNGDGTLELIATRYSGATPSALVGLWANSDPPTEVANLPLDREVAMLTADVFDSVTQRGASQLVFARSDGYLWVLDGTLTPTNVESTGEIPLRGLRTGGFYAPPLGVGAAPLAADVDGDGTAEVLVRDSRGRMRLMSTAGANLLEPPTDRWMQTALSGIFVNTGGAAGPEIALVESSGDGDDVVVREASGAVRWRSRIGSSTTSVDHDLVAGDVSGDGTPDLAYTLRDSAGGDGVYNVLSGVDGSPLWASSYRIQVAGSGNGPMSLHELDGAGALEVLATPQNLLSWLGTADGRPVASIDGGYPFVALRADTFGGPRWITSGAVNGVRAVTAGLSSAEWVKGASGSDFTTHYGHLGAVVVCAGVSRLVQPHHQSARLTAWDAATGAIAADVGLRGGTRYEDVAATPDGAGVLGNLTVSPDLTGNGRPALLVPASDGHLYAVDACDLSLIWSLDFRVQVGEPVLADVDGDGLDEILVTVADGYLYGVDQEVIAPPSFIADTAVPLAGATPADDIDELATTDTLHASWAPVAGATSYEYAVITPGGAFLTSPSFINVGAATQATASLLPLTVGRTYQFAVRAIGPDGASREQLSDGVRVLPDPCAMCEAGLVCVDGACVPPETAPDGGVGQPDAGPTPPDPMEGGCAIAPGRQPGAALGLLLVVAMLLSCRRRRASAGCA